METTEQDLRVTDTATGRLIDTATGRLIDTAPADLKATGLSRISLISTTESDPRRPLPGGRGALIDQLCSRYQTPAKYPHHLYGAGGPGGETPNHIHRNPSSQRRDSGEHRDSRATTSLVSRDLP